MRSRTFSQRCQFPFTSTVTTLLTPRAAGKGERGPEHRFFSSNDQEAARFAEEAFLTTGTVSGGKGRFPAHISAVRV